MSSTAVPSCHTSVALWPTSYATTERKFPDLSSQILALDLPETVEALSGGTRRLKAGTGMLEDRRASAAGKYKTDMSWGSAVLAGMAEPHYRRTYIQGCVCKAGVAGGACCPANAAGVVAQSPGAMHSGAQHTVMLPLAGVGAFLSVVGIFSGVRVLRQGWDALKNLRAVDAVWARRENSLRLTGGSYAAYPQWSRKMLHVNDADEAQNITAAQSAAPDDEEIKENEDDIENDYPHTLPATQKHGADAVAAARSMRRALHTSLSEQHFNLAIPGVLQIAASSTAGLAAAHMLGLGLIGSVAGVILGVTASCLFAAYGAALAIKALVLYIRVARAGAPPPSDVATSYMGAVDTHLRAQRAQHARSVLAWSAVMTAGVAGALMGLGVLTFPWAGLVVGVSALAAAGWAIWEGSRTRYAPHIPVSRHVAPEFLLSTKDCSKTWELLRAQDDAIKLAVQKIEQERDFSRTAYLYEQLFQPQCGTNAFRVLANAVAAEARTYDGILVAAAKTFVAAERQLWTYRLEAQNAELETRRFELKAIVDPCCGGEQGRAKARTVTENGTVTERILRQACESFQADAASFADATQRLAVLDFVQDKLTGLDVHIHALNGFSNHHRKPYQTDWLYIRIILLQLQGSLGDAISDDLIAEHPEFFSQLSGADTLPLGNVHVQVHKLSEFVEALAPDISAQFVHSFFNPRRIEAEMDYVMEQDLVREPEAYEVQAATCTDRSCCSN